MRSLLIGMFIILLASCSLKPDKISNTAEDEEIEDLNLLESTSLPIIAPAPELENDIWLNTDKSLRLSDMEDKVVLLEMWTFG